MVEIITKNKKYTNGIVTECKRVKLNINEIDIEPYSNVAKAKYSDSLNPQYNHDVLFIATSFEELMSIIFKTKNSESYSSGNTNLDDENDIADYHKFFYEDKEGIGRYASCGGNMD